MTVKPLPGDQASPQQSNYVRSLLYELNSALPYDGPDLWTAELNTRCNLNVGSIDELTKQEASRAIDSLREQVGVQHKARMSLQQSK